MRIRSVSAVAVSAFFLLVSCLAPVNSWALFDRVTIRDEVKMGRDFDRLVRQKMPIVEDPVVNDYVEGIVKKIVEAKKPMPFDIKTAVIQDPSMNAFAIPGGYIYVFTGLVLNVNSESELAAVIAHELAHASQRHMASRMEKQQKIGVASAIGTLAGAFLGIAGGGDSAAKAGQALIVGAQAGAYSAMLGYSRDDENEADHVGLNSLVIAGYNPKGMPATFESMIKNKWFTGVGDIPSYLSTHPQLEERVQYLKDRINRMPSEFTSRQDDNTALHRIQAVLRAWSSDPQRTLGYFKTIPAEKMTALDYMGQGVAYSRLKRQQEADQAFKLALEHNGTDPLILREVGAFYYRTGRLQEASPLLQQAIFRNPSDLISRFYMARLLADSGESDQALPIMRKILVKLPHDAEVHYYMGRILGESGDAFGGHLHLAWSAYYTGDKKKLRFQMEKARSLAQSEAQKAELQKLEDEVSPPKRKDGDKKDGSSPEQGPKG